MAEDLYDILEVDRNASDAEIKRSYRRLARKYHPDVNKDPGAEATFKKIQKSYDVLSDSSKKAHYDRFGVADDSPGGGGAGAGGFGGFDGFSSGFEGQFEDIFDAFFGGNRRQGGGGGGAQGGMAGEDLRYDLTITLEEAAFGLEKKLDIFYLQVDSGKSTKCQKCNGQGKVTVVQRTMLGAFQQVTTCPDCGGTGGIQRKKVKKSIEVTIPAGIEGGQKLRVKGEGNQGGSGGPSGDLYVFVTVKDHKYFQRDGQDVVLGVDVSITDAILGVQIEIPTLKGKADLKIPAGTQPGATLRLKGKGIPSIRGFGRGDQLVVVSVAIPKSITSKQRKLIEELATLEDTKKASIWDSVKKAF